MSTKDELLQCLKKEKGIWVSGEFLGQKLAVSRTAVWKHISALKEAGYQIESSRKKGHVLIASPDALLESEIREALNTKRFAKAGFFHFNDTESTNLTAEKLAEEGAPEGTLVVAEYQTRGKGRIGRSWFSPRGEGIYASLILRPEIFPTEAPKLTLMASVAIAEAIRAFAPVDASIKWPNDILIGGKKVCGILTEMRAEMDRIYYVVIGVGINVNTPYESLPRDIRHTATSLSIETGRSFSRTELLRKCLESFEKNYEIFKKRGFDPVKKRWEHLTKMIGEEIRVDMVGVTHTGVCQGISKDGFLIMKDHEGGLRKIISGDVSIVKH